jgi:hypothetical protein
MLNILLNRYYIKNANRSLAITESRLKALSQAEAVRLVEKPATGAGTSQRGQVPHAKLRVELQDIWTRHLTREEGQASTKSNFCRHN